MDTHTISLTAVLSKLAYKSLPDVHALWVMYKDIPPQIPKINFDEEVLLHIFFHDLVHPPTLLQCPHNREDTQAFVFIQKDILTVVFRGSSSGEDFLADIDIGRYCLKNHCEVSVPKGVIVHKGFYKQYTAIESELLRILITFSPQTIRFCGHSLGGALSQIAAAHIASHPYFQSTLISCLTFGSPRVGNRAFVQWFQSCVKHHYRIVHQSDPVPNMPIMPIWIHTFDQCIKVTKENGFSIIDHDAPWYMRLFMVLKNLFPWSFLSFTDHSIDVYAQAWIKIHRKTLCGKPTVPDATILTDALLP